MKKIFIALLFSTFLNYCAQQRDQLNITAKSISIVAKDNSTMLGIQVDEYGNVVQPGQPTQPAGPAQVINMNFNEPISMVGYGHSQQTFLQVNAVQEQARARAQQQAFVQQINIRLANAKKLKGFDKYIETAELYLEKMKALGYSEEDVKSIGENLNQANKLISKNADEAEEQVMRFTAIKYQFQQEIKKHGENAGVAQRNRAGVPPGGPALADEHPAAAAAAAARPRAAVAKNKSALDDEA